MPGSATYDVFVCHANSDRNLVNPLVRQLREAGITVWIDDDQVEPGQSIVGRIQEGLSQSRYLLVCLSPAFLESSWCRAELAAVLKTQVDSDQARVLPVVIAGLEDAAIPPLLADIRHSDVRSGPGLEQLLAFLTGTKREARPVVDQGPVTEVRLILRQVEDGIEGSWSTSEGQGEPFVFTSPISSDDAKDHRWYLEDFVRFPGVGDISRARAFEKRLAGWGEKLLAAIRAGDGSQRLLDLVNNRKPCLLTLVSSDPDPLSLPWELLRDDRSPLIARGLVLRRQLPKAIRGIRHDLGLPLRILLVVSRPTDVGFIDPRSSTMPMLDALEPLGGNVTVEFCEPPTLAELARRLGQARQRGKGYDIVHFDGHGVYLPRTGVGALCFENDRGSNDLVPGTRLGDLLAQMDIPATLLEACQTSDLSTMPVFGSVAPALLKSGVGSVIAFSHSVLVSAARIMVEQLYTALCQGQTVGQAVNQGRLALMATAERELAPGQEPLPLRDWHIPQLYQAGADPALVPGGAPRTGGGTPVAAGRKPDPAFGRQPVYGFHGRSRELLDLRRKLMAHPAVALTGMGGMGKTSLAREAAHWWTRTGRRRDGATFFSFESRQGADRAVQAFGHYLEGDAFDRLSSDDRWQRTLELFHQREVLWVWDNFESTLPAFQGGRATGTAFPDEERQRLRQLYDQLLEGKPRGWLLVTCRPGSTGLTGIGEMELRSLSAPEALELATVILQRKDVPLGQPGWERDRIVSLLATLGHHPLSLELVLPHLRHLSPAAVEIDLGRLLDRFTDTTAEEERNRGLLASLAFSTSHLSDDAQQVLPWLGCFDGGAFEANIIALSEIDPESWTGVRDELLATALVEVDDEILAGNRPFLRFHPTLAYAAATTEVADQDAARERFVTIYLASAAGVDKLLRGESPATGMAVMEREEGSMRRAVELAFAAGDHRRAWSIADTVGIYLEMAGRVRDQARWSAWVRDEIERVAGGDLHLDESTLAGVRQHAWGLLTEGKAGEAVELLQGLIARLEFAEGDDIPGQLALSQNYLGRVLYSAGQPGQALAPLDRAIKGFEAIADRPNLSVALGDQANALLALGRHEQALKAAERGLTIDRELGRHREIATGLGRTAQILMNMQRWDEAEQRYQEGLEAARTAKDPGLEGSLLQHLGSLLDDRGRFPEAVARYQEALSLFQRADHVEGEMRTCDLLGTAEVQQEHFDAARAWYERARELAARLGDRGQLAATSQNLGILLQSQAETLPEDSDERRPLLLQAIASIEEASRIDLEMGNDIGAASSYSQLGVLQRMLGELDQAEQRSLDAMRIRENLDLPDVWKVYANLEAIANDRGDTDAAAEWRARKEAKLAELQRLRTQGAGPALPPQLVKALLAMAQGAFQVRTGGGASPPDLDEALTAMADNLPEPFPALAAHLRSVARGDPLPPLPSGLPPELTSIFDSLHEAIGSSG
jgi:tetratricopeptide (TPR) repeat protein